MTKVVKKISEEADNEILIVEKYLKDLKILKKSLNKRLKNTHGK